VFSDLTLGYYLVDSTAGALCGLTTTDPDASINAKNGVPTIDKQVQEDLTGMWGDVNTADIGQIVNFMSIIHVAPGAENYVLHDKMSTGLTFQQDLTKGRGVTEIKHITSLGVETTLVLDTDYTVKTSTTDDCDFEVVFSDTLTAGLKANERLIVYYNAMLNRYAESGHTDGNKNESWLEYGEEHFTTHDETKTYTFSIDIVKTDAQNKLIDGAKFRIYDAATGGNEIEVVPLMEADDITPVRDDNGNPMYRRARADETGVEIVVKDGHVTVVGASEIAPASTVDRIAERVRHWVRTL
jgi:fimbrial isopeptide formation D2 family protein